jgi:hypothetical protein
MSMNCAFLCCWNRITSTSQGVDAEADQTAQFYVCQPRLTLQTRRRVVLSFFVEATGPIYAGKSGTRHAEPCAE